MDSNSAPPQYKQGPLPIGIPESVVQGDQKGSVHRITVQKTRKNILNSSNHLPW
jgi:hypothetical protein